MDKKNRIIGFGILILLFGIGFVFAADPPASGLTQVGSSGFSTYSSGSSFQGYSNGYSGVNRQGSFDRYYSGADINSYWPILGNREQCDARQDFILQVAPLGCQPAVVRSDLLAEQNVPVFCQIDALKLNPLVDVSEIKNIRFTGKYPEGIVGSGFHPARAAIKTNDRLLGSPTVNNIGYVVVVVKQNANESSLPENVNVTLTAKIEYDSLYAFGVGKGDFLLEEVSDLEWGNEKNRQSFWNGRYYVRLEEADPNFAIVSIYNGDDKVSDFRVRTGETSKQIYVPGSYCRAGLSVAYDGLVSADDRAIIEVSSEKGTDRFDVYDRSSFLNGKCNVVEVESSDGTTGKVVLNCRGEGTSRIVLEKGAYSDPVGTNYKYLNNIALERTPNLNLDDKFEVYYVNGISINGAKNNYGIAREKSNSNSDWKLVKMDEKRRWNEIAYTGELSVLREEIIKKFNYIYGNKGQVVNDLQLDDITKKKFDEAIDDYVEVADDYPSEKLNGVEGSSTIGEIALDEAIELAHHFGQQHKEIELIEKLVQTYPNSAYSVKHQARLNDLYNYDTTRSATSIYVDNSFKTIRLVGFKKTSSGNKQENAFFSVNGQTYKIEADKEETKQIRTGKEIKIRLDKLESDRVVADFYCYVNGKEDEKRENQELRIDYARDEYGRLSSQTSRISSYATLKICGETVTLQDVNSQEFAKIRIIPSGQDTSTETNISVNIGIEKRAIQLSPDKTKEQIAKLNQTIIKWEGISQSLGKVVSGLKTACFATSAVLQVKNFITGLSGEGLARNQIMRGANGWNAKCDKYVNEGKYQTMNQCLIREADNINSDVKTYAGKIDEINSNIASLENSNNCKKSGNGILSGDYIDQSCAVPAYTDYLKSKYKDNPITDPNTGKQTTVGELLASDSKEGYANGKYSYSQLRDLELNLQLQGTESEVLKANSQTNLESITKNYYDNSQRIDSTILSQKNAKNGVYTPTHIGDSGKIITTPIASASAIPSISSLPAGIGANEKVSYVYVDGATNNNGVILPKGNYILVLQDVGGSYRVSRVVSEVTGQDLSGNDLTYFTTTYGSTVSDGSLSCNNKYTNPKIKYYETEPYKGLPAIVAFDIQRGWYVATKQTLPAFGNQEAYKASGQLSSFQVCNVGRDGREQFFEGGGDDECTLINLDTGQPLNQISCLSSSDARKLVTDAINAIQQASRQHGQSLVRISVSGRGEVSLKPEIAANVPTTQCQDFMDPKDCNLMFNVCDPVICPASRCDFGGQYKVDDVIQTGIVGSALLCLPNYKEGIVAPVCLTGIQAGIDGYLSILKGYRDCLQESVDSGESVGICDEIYSIYTCEFFWRQVAPVANVLFPKLVEMAYGKGQGTRGGGEYLTVMGAWDNTRNSVNYFTQSYAVNSIKAFQVRSIEEAGGEFCKAFISTKAPSGLKSLVEPDSPSQFHAWFSTTKFSDATVPPTSQYKVFYHIFAGNDQGVSYRVYLRNPPQTAYYSTSPIINVQSGYIKKGEYASQTRDFSAPEGYKELCVDINGKEECGFTQVSSSFAVNYLRDSYVSDQISKKDITSEKECISGSSDPRSLLNPNLEAGVQETVSPEIYNRGVIRVCATSNPGQSTDPSRYVEVGYCDDRKIKCWIDKRSVDAAITKANVGVKNDTLQELQSIQQGNLVNSGEFYGYPDAKVKIDDIVKRWNDVKKDNVLDNSDVTKLNSLINEINILLPKVIYNDQKAYLIFTRAQIKARLASKDFKPVTGAGAAAVAGVGIGGISPGLVANTREAYQDYSIKLSEDEFVNYDSSLYKNEISEIESNLDSKKISEIKEIAQKSDLPPELVAAIWYRESNFEYSNLADGGPLSGNFIDTAVNALNVEKTGGVIGEIKSNSPDFDSSSQDITAMATFAERYNGFGYRINNYNSKVSPYVLSGTRYYNGFGKYQDRKAEDGSVKGVYNSGLEEKQLGVIPLILYFADKDTFRAFEPNVGSSYLPSDSNSISDSGRVELNSFYDPESTEPNFIYHNGQKTDLFVIGQRINWDNPAFPVYGTYNKDTAYKMIASIRVSNSYGVEFGAEDIRSTLDSKYPGLIDYIKDKALYPGDNTFSKVDGTSSSTSSQSTEPVQHNDPVTSAVASRITNLMFQFKDGTTESNWNYRYNSGNNPGWEVFVNSWVSVNDEKNYASEMNQQDLEFTRTLNSLDFRSGVGRLLLRVNKGKDNWYNTQPALEIGVIDSSIKSTIEYGDPLLTKLIEVRKDNDETLVNFIYSSELLNSN